MNAAYYLMRQLTVILYFLIPACCFSQTRKECDSLARLLEKIAADDQQFRQSEWDSTIQKYGMNSNEFIELVRKMNLQDSINMSVVGKIIDKYGWLGTGQVSEKANEALFLVLQHAPLESQLTYLPVLKQAVKSKKAKAADYALLVDRTNMRQGKFQVYGSQLNYDSKGNLHIYPIYDEPGVNKRRKSVGLPPMEAYVKMADSSLSYSLPKTDAYRNKIVITGSTVQKENNMPAGNVRILLAGNIPAGHSDASGFFQITVDKRAATHILLFKKEGLQTMSVTIADRDKDVIELQVALSAQ